MLYTTNKCVTVSEWPLGSQTMLIHTTDGTIECNMEHFTRIQDLFFPVNYVLTQSVLQAHSPNAGIEHSTSLSGMLIQLSNTLQYADTILPRPVFRLPCFAITNSLPRLSVQDSSLYYLTFLSHTHHMPPTFPCRSRKLTTCPISF
jgi:hypothetical protein